MNRSNFSRRNGVITILLFITFFVYSQDDKVQIIDRFIHDTMDDWHVPGLAIAIVKDNDVIFSKGYGVRDIDTKMPIDINTVFQICSITKTFTASGIGMLVQDGKLNWDDHVIDYIPEFKLSDPYATREITVRDLLCHRTGLPMYCLDPIVFNREDFDVKEVIRRIQYIEPDYSLRSAFKYTNATFLIAGEIISEVSGLNWDDFIQQKIFNPLKMTSSFTDFNDLKKNQENNVATPYKLIDEKIVKVPNFEFNKTKPAASICSNVTDLAQWIKAIASNGKYEGKEILKPSIIDEMESSQVVIRPRGYWETPYLGAKILTYGLGWFIYEYAGEKVIQHGGGTLGYRSTLCVVPDKKFGFIILTNLGTGNNNLPEVISYKILDVFFGKDDHDWNSVFLTKLLLTKEQNEAKEKQLISENVKGTIPAFNLKDYSGIYENQFIGKINIECDSTYLKIKLGDGRFSNGKLRHWHFNTFRIMWDYDFITPCLVTFHIGAEGSVNELNIENFGIFKRVLD